MRKRCLATAIATVLLVLGPARAPADAQTCPAPPDAPEGAEAESLFERATDCLLDAERGVRGLAGLRRVRRLDAAAERHARDMVMRGYFSHVSPAGRTLLDRVRATGYLRGWADWRLGEVLAWGTGQLGSPRAVMDAWLASPGHRRLILTAAYRNVGIGVVTGVPHGGASGATYAVVLGRRRAG